MIYKLIEKNRTKIFIASFLSWLNFYVLIYIFLYYVGIHNPLISFLLSLIVYWYAVLYFYINPNKFFPSKNLYEFYVYYTEPKIPWYVKIGKYLYKGIIVLLIIGIVISILISIFFLYLLRSVLPLFLGFLIFFSILILFSIIFILDVVQKLKENKITIKTKNNEEKSLKNIVENLRIAYGIQDKPIRVVVIDLPYINAFVLENPYEYILFVSDEALKLDYYLLECLIAHEMAHIKNKDSYYMTKILVFGGITIMLSYLFIRILPRILFSNSLKEKEKDNSLKMILLFVGIILAILTPIIQKILISTISKSKEIIADLEAVKITKLCDEYIKLLKIVKEDYTKNYSKLKPNKLISALYFFDLDIETHPPIEKRIKIVKKACTA